MFRITMYGFSYGKSFNSAKATSFSFRLIEITTTFALHVIEYRRRYYAE